MYKYILFSLIFTFSFSCKQSDNSKFHSKDDLSTYNIKSIEEAKAIHQGGEKPVLSLSLEDSKESTIPEDIFTLTDLQKLTLTSCRYREISDEIRNLQDLQYLHTLFTPIKHISTEISALPHLKELAIVNGKLTDLPDSWEDDSNLQFINLRNNKIKIIPGSINNLEELEHLDLSSNSIKELPTLDDLDELKLLNLSDNRIKFLEDDAFDGLDELSTLNLGANPLKNLPSSITDLSDLEYLILTDTNISEFPEGMENLKKLKELDLSYCKKIKPETLESLRSLLPNTQILTNQL